MQSGYFLSRGWQARPGFLQILLICTLAVMLGPSAPPENLFSKKNKSDFIPNNPASSAKVENVAFWDIGAVPRVPDPTDPLRDFNRVVVGPDKLTVAREQIKNKKNVASGNHPSDRSYVPFVLMGISAVLIFLGYRAWGDPVGPERRRRLRRARRMPSRQMPNGRLSDSRR